MKNYYISIYLDIRRAKLNGKFPVKLSVFTTEPRKQKLYPTQFDFTENEFMGIWPSYKTYKKAKDSRTKDKTGKVKEEKKTESKSTLTKLENDAFRLKLQEVENNANKIAEGLTAFNFEDFEKLLFNKNGSKDKDVNFYYQQAIDDYTRNKQVGTALNYKYSLKSLMDFHNNTSKEKKSEVNQTEANRIQKNLNFQTITVQWLKDYEYYMIKTLGRSQTTVGIFLRPLRAIFNVARSEKTISNDNYPFGSKKFVIPAPKATKKALSKEQLKNLWETEPATPEQAKAKAFWFFSYTCNGMNIKDILNLQFKNISGDLLEFRRAKTVNTNKEQQAVKVYLTDFAKQVIEQYGNPIKSADSYVFPIIDQKAIPEKKHKQVGNFIKFINQNLGTLAKNSNIEFHISTYTARHSFATNAIRSGASIEYVSEALSHSNLNTTKGYFAGFEDETKKQFAKKMMEF